MDDRVILANEISKLILKNETDVRKIISEVNRFDELLEDTIRNFYEIKEDEEAPLFQLCEYLKLGADNYGLDQQEYNEIIESLIQEVNEIFGYSLELSNKL